MSAPLVSICLPNLNNRPFLQERMETLLAQTMGDWELIISDNHSDDGSWEFFQKFKDDRRVRLSQAPRAGMYANWNECLRRATGEFVYVATADDTAEPKLLESLLAPLERRAEISVAMCDMQEIDERGHPLDRQKHIREFYGKWMTTPSIRNGKTECLLHSCFGPTWVTMTSVLFRRKLVEDGLWFRTDCGSVADAEWAMRASLASDIAFVPGRLATWRVHATQASGSSRSRDVLGVLLWITQSVLRGERSGIPTAWKAVPGWEEQICTVWRSQYFNEFGLVRGMLKKQPGQFLCNAASALRREPAFFLNQALSAFAWSKEKFDREPSEVARHLIELFRSPWPPKAVTGGW